MDEILELFRAHASLPQDAGKTWKIGNDIHTVAYTAAHDHIWASVRPYHTILRVADHKYAHT